MPLLKGDSQELEVLSHLEIYQFPNISELEERWTNESLFSGREFGQWEQRN